MTEYAIVPTTDEHVEELTHSMSPEDVVEAWAAGHFSPSEALKVSMMYTNYPKTGLVDGRVMAIWGVGKVTQISEIGIPWMLTSIQVEKHFRAFLRYSKGLLDDMKNETLVFDNVVDARNLVSIRWLRWLGFTIHDALPYGPDDMPFHRFTMEN